MSTALPETHLDCKGLKCPMPIVTISKTIKTLASGQTLVVEANDPAFKVDVEAWVAKLGHTLVSFTDGSVQQAVIKKS